jgi:hypothetical protein
VYKTRLNYSFAPPASTVNSASSTSVTMHTTLRSPDPPLAPIERPEDRSRCRGVGKVRFNNRFGPEHGVPVQTMPEPERRFRSNVRGDCSGVRTEPNTEPEIRNDEFRIIWIDSALSSITPYLRMYYCRERSS